MFFLCVLFISEMKRGEILLKPVTDALRTIPSVTAMLGVGTYSATKVVDAIFLGLGTVKVLALLLSCGASVSFGLVMLKTLTKKIGKKAAVSF